MKFIFKNTNKHTSNVSFSSAYISETKNLDIARSGILNNEGIQTFYIDFTYNSEFIKYLKLEVDYFTEEGYVFIQDIVVWKENDGYKMLPGTIIDKNNSPVK